MSDFALALSRLGAAPSPHAASRNLLSAPSLLSFLEEEAARLSELLSSEELLALPSARAHVAGQLSAYELLKDALHQGHFRP